MSYDTWSDNHYFVVRSQDLDGDGNLDGTLTLKADIIKLVAADSVVYDSPSIVLSGSGAACDAVMLSAPHGGVTIEPAICLDINIGNAGYGRIRNTTVSAFIGTPSGYTVPTGESIRTGDISIESANRIYIETASTSSTSYGAYGITIDTTSSDSGIEINSGGHLVIHNSGNNGDYTDNVQIGSIRGMTHLYTGSNSGYLPNDSGTYIRMINSNPSTGSYNITGLYEDMLLFSSDGNILVQAEGEGNGVHLHSKAGGLNFKVGSESGIEGFWGENDCITMIGNRQGTNALVQIVNLNNSSSDPGDVLDLHTGFNTPPHSMNYITFWDNYSGTRARMGAVQGSYVGDATFMEAGLSSAGKVDAAASTDSTALGIMSSMLCNAIPFLNAIIDAFDGSDGDGCSSLIDDYFVETSHDGHVQYVSGHADFGEWIAIGNLEEWTKSEQECFEGIVKRGCWGLEEGVVVYINNGKIFRYGPGTPMVVTKRALCVGNAKVKMMKNKEDFSGLKNIVIKNIKERLDVKLENLHGEEIDGRPAEKVAREVLEMAESDEFEERALKASYAGEVVSFLGQLPVIVSGSARQNDYIVPVDDEPYCVALDPDNITFEQYKRALGTVWEDLDPEDGKQFCKPLCAIGVK